MVAFFSERSSCSAGDLPSAFTQRQLVALLCDTAQIAHDRAYRAAEAAFARQRRLVVAAPPRGGAAVFMAAAIIGFLFGLIGGAALAAWLATL